MEPIRDLRGLRVGDQSDASVRIDLDVLERPQACDQAWRSGWTRVTLRLEGFLQHIKIDPAAGLILRQATDDLEHLIAAGGMGLGSRLLW